ncbi:MAG: alpha/beta hydrolase [Acidobacteria bacterium]|nr:alpha/beta hydrolase [Acidobacteriota bacterium]
MLALMRSMLLVMTGALAALGQTTELLWPGGAPGAAGEEDQDKPSITIYLAEKAIVLKYRLGPRYRHPAPLNDAQRAIRMVRSRAAEFKIDPKRIGIWGFSAGGHLAATAATHFDSGRPNSADPVERAGSRPDFAILCYPVISFREYAHAGSRRNLLGDHPDPKLVENLSNETQVTPETPPTFLFHTNDDPGVPVENSVLFYLALRRAKVPAEMHIYEHGRHGVGLAPGDPVLSTWPPRLADWLRVRGII